MDDNNQEIWDYLEYCDHYLVPNLIFSNIYFEDLEPASIEHHEELIYTLNLN